MIQLSEYGINVVNNFNLVGSWIAVTVCCRNFTVCLRQYKRTRGKIHLVNLAQVSVFCLHRTLYGLIPLFLIQTCAYFPLLVSLWHITYILFYTVMFMRLIILEHDRNSRWIKVVGVLLITLRFADWPYELALHAVPRSTTQCWAQWGTGVIILNFIGDALANLFLSGMFVRRLFIHMRASKSIISYQNKIIERIAKKSLICLALTFVVNLAMNLLKVTNFLGDQSDVFTVYFEIVESTLLVEALRNDGNRQASPHGLFCENCKRELSPVVDSKIPNNDNRLSSQMFVQFPDSSDKTLRNHSFSNNSHALETIVTSVEPVIFLDSNSNRSHNPYMYYQQGQSYRGISSLVDDPLPAVPTNDKSTTSSSS